ncbi:unnamed protein product [Calypogeia fissa]
MSLEVPGKPVDNSRLVTLYRLTDGDAHQLQRVNGLGRLAYGKIPNLGMRSLVKYGTTRILLKIGYDNMGPFRVQVDFVKKQQKGKEVMLVDVSHLVTPKERRVFLDEPVPQNGVTLGGTRISKVTSLAKVLLEELVVAQGDQVMARSELTPLRSEHDKVMKQNKAFKAQLEELRGRLQGTQLDMQKLQEEKNIIESARQDMIEKHGELKKKHASESEEWEKTR